MAAEVSLAGRLRRQLRCWIDSEERELSRIASIPRFEAGTTRLFGRPVEFVDSASFVYMYREIVQREIYAFDCSYHDPVIIDAGANIGLSVLYQKLRFPQARVIGIEADPAVFAVLRRNLNRFGLEDVELHQLALWDEQTKLEFFSQGADAGRVGMGDTDDRRQCIFVDSVPLSTFLVGHVDLLKIDIEGAELRVLLEAKSKLLHVERIFVEYHSFRDQPQDLGELLQLLRDSGFRIQIQSVGLLPRPFLQNRAKGLMDMQLNIFGLRAHS